MARGDHRKDIDGLRAVAVLPVVLYHAGVSWLGGGYTGVDVFFVISGFLITGILARDIAKAQSAWEVLVAFYDRRIRRIFPALFAMLAVLFAVGLAFFLPQDLVGLARSHLATLISGSNVLFFRESGYFDLPSESKPLLHTWSLAVEEQFYLGFPVLLILIARYSPRLRSPAIWLMFAASLALAAVGAFRAPSFTFYLPATRMWELLAGSIVALAMVPPIRGQAAREAAAGLGVAAVLAPMFVLTSKTPFPGLAALPTVLGTALLLHSGEGTVVGRALSARVPVAIGLISYSLYLWHWPIIVAGKYLLVEAPEGLWWLAFVLAASIAAAWLSWRFVERPFRRPGWRLRTTYALAAVGMVVMAVPAVVVIATDGLPQRMTPAVLARVAAARDFSPMRRQCHFEEGSAKPIAASCVFGAPVPPAMAIWGDSHAVELSYAMGEVAKAEGRAVREISYSACPPVTGTALFTRACRAHNQAVLDYLVADRTTRTVVLIAFYGSEFITDRADFAASLRRSVERLRAAGKTVVLVDPMPLPRMNVPSGLARYAARGVEDERLNITWASYRRTYGWVFAMLDGLAGPGVVRVHPAERLCRGDRCFVEGPEGVYYFDGHHLSMTGARRVAPLFRDLISR
jgi:peptidoglycan/LPS O-acetylase OafA/YrhL